jgi:hypothetical protein
MTWCQHPNGHVHYYSEIDDIGREYEELWCDVCNCWMTPAEANDFHERPDWEYAKDRLS